MRIAIRGFQNRRKVFEVRVNAEETDLEALAREHALRLVGQPHMIEVEFLDEPDPLQRFFRLGTDPYQMRMPVEVKLEEL